MIIKRLAAALVACGLILAGCGVGVGADKPCPHGYYHHGAVDGLKYCKRDA